MKLLVYILVLAFVVTGTLSAVFFVIGLEHDSLKILPLWFGVALFFPSIFLMTAIIIVLKRGDDKDDALRLLTVHCALCLATKQAHVKKAIVLRACPDCPTRLLLARHNIAVPA